MRESKPVGSCKEQLWLLTPVGGDLRAASQQRCDAHGAVETFSWPGELVDIDPVAEFSGFTQGLHEDVCM